MLKFRSTPFEEEIEKATNENNLTEDWALIMHICDNAINYQDGAKFCLKAILKRLHHNVPRVVLQALTLLDCCVKNCDRNFLLQVASSDFTTEVRKLLSKMHPSAAEKLKELIQKWSLEEFKDDAELCIIPALYYKLKSEGVEFSPMVKDIKPAPPMCTDPDAVSSQEEENDIIKAIEISLKDTGRYQAPVEFPQLSESSSVLEPFKVRTIYDFEAAEDNELTIKSGEIVLVLDNSNSSWWKGSNHRGEGLFPANFVTKDLNYIPEEPPVEQKTIVKESSVDEPSKNIEVKLDEEKIEMTINWLNEADPTGEIPDPDEMLLLERECSSMAPLLEDKLQAVDNRLALLNLVNKQIVDSFDLFYSLSDSVFTSHQLTNRNYTPANFERNRRAFPPSQISSTVAVSATQQNTATMHGAFYVPAPSVGSQFIMSSELMHNRPICAVQSPHEPRMPSIPAYFHPQMTSHTEANAQLTQVSNSNITSVSVENPVSSSTETSLLHMVPHAGTQYSTHHVPFPPQTYGPYVQNSGFIPGPSQLPNYMTLPYPIASVGPYFSLPCFYPNSNVATPSSDTAISSSSNDPSSCQLPVPVKKSPVVTEINVASGRSIESSYSSDLHQINISNGVGTTQTQTQYVRTDQSYQASSLTPETSTVATGVKQTHSVVAPTDQL